MKLSVVIPTYNEEKYLPRLLRCLNNQTFQDFEIIVSDAFSKDKTREIAAAFGARVVDGGKIAVGRNNGAKAAKADLILFLDADVTFEDDFIEESLKEFEERGLDIATAYFDKKIKSKTAQIAYSLWDTDKFLRQFTKSPSGAGHCIFIKKEAFNKVNGFNQEIIVGEDVDFIKRVAQSEYKFRVLSTKYKPSDRRYVQMGIGKVIAGSVLGGLSVGLGLIVAQKMAEKMYGGWGYDNQKSKRKHSYSDSGKKFIEYTRNLEKKMLSKKEVKN